MYIGNVLLLILNLPLIGLWVRPLLVPPRILMPLILMFCLTGTYAVSANLFDLWVKIAFGVAGFALQRYGFPIAPIVLGLILGPMLETHFHRALTVSRGDYGIFLQRPIAATLLAVAVLYLLVPGLTRAWRGRRLRRGQSTSSSRCRTRSGAQGRVGTLWWLVSSTVSRTSMPSCGAAWVRS